MTGLTNGDAYTFTVAATNAVGTGPASTASNAVTPVATPANPVPTPADPPAPSATTSLAATGSDLLLPAGLAGLLLIAGSAVIGVARTLGRSEKQHIS